MGWTGSGKGTNVWVGVEGGWGGVIIVCKTWDTVPSHSPVMAAIVVNKYIARTGMSIVKSLPSMMFRVETQFRFIYHWIQSWIIVSKTIKASFNKGNALECKAVCVAKEWLLLLEILFRYTTTWSCRDWICFKDDGHPLYDFYLYENLILSFVLQ